MGSPALMTHVKCTGNSLAPYVVRCNRHLRLEIPRVVDLGHHATYLRAECSRMNTCISKYPTESPHAAACFVGTGHG